MWGNLMLAVRRRWNGDKLARFVADVVVLALLRLFREHHGRAT